MRRFLLFTPALVAALAIVGCNGGGDAGGDVDVSNLTERDPMDQAAFAEGFSAAREIRRDSTLPFDMDLFLEGFQHGIDGDTARLSYLYGFQIGGQMRQDTVLRLDRERFLEGFRFGIDNDSLPMTASQQARLRAVIGDTLTMRDLRNRARTDEAARTQLADATRNATQSEAFLTRLSQADSVQTTDSGLRYVVVAPGQGASPNAQDIVLVRLIGRLPDGTPLTMGAGTESVPVQVGAFAVEGINEALLAMKPGERRRLYIPPGLAFGMRGMESQGEQPGVPPSSVVIFDVTLESVMGPASALQGDRMAPGSLPPGAMPPGAVPAQ